MEKPGDAPVTKVEAILLLKRQRNRFAHEAITEVRKAGFAQPELIDPLNPFLRQLADTTGPAMLGLIHENRGYVRPILRVVLGWPTSLDPTNGQSGELYKVRSLHLALAMSLNPNWDTILEHVFNPTFQEVGEFKVALNRLTAESSSERVLTGIEIPAYRRMLATR